MTVVDLFRALIRLVHVLGAVAWVGGGIFYLLVLNPAWALGFDRERANELRAAIGQRFRELTGTCITALVVSGVVISVDRLTDTRVNLTYGLILALKLLLVGLMYVVFRTMGDRSERRRWSSPETLLGLGVAVFFVTIILRLTYEAILRA